MSGDMRVKGLIDGTVGMAGRIGEIDAHSVASGDFTEGRCIGGKEVFMTLTGAKMVDDLLSRGFRFEALEDPVGIFDKLLAPKQQHSGKVQP